MNPVADLGQWWNLIYVVPFCLGLALTLLAVAGVGRHGHHAGYAHGHHAHTHHGHGHHHGARHHARQAHRSQRDDATASLWRMLHLQNIPSMMLVQNLLLFWGICGWTANRLLASGGAPARFLPVSLAAALGGGGLLSLAVSSVLARYTPTDESYAVTKTELEGRLGEADGTINEKVGSTYVRDARGTLHHLAARTRREAPPIHKGEPVLVSEYEPTGDFYWVGRWQEDEQRIGVATPREAVAVERQKEQVEQL